MKENGRGRGAYWGERDLDAEKERIMIEQSKQEEIAYYYDSHPTEEDLMGETAIHVVIIRYLVLVLSWLFEGQTCAIHQNLNIYQTANPTESPLAPDITVIKGVPFTLVTSWHAGTSGPPPQVVFEIASEETWERDLMEKPLRYSRLGVQEYYAFDPHEPPLPSSRRRGQHFFGWHRHPHTARLEPVALRADGSVWSPQLASLLVPDSSALRLFDRSGHLRLTKEEAETQAKLLALQEAQRQTQRAEAEAHRAEIEARNVRTLAEKLRSLGIDPDQLL